jgi:ribosomal protein S19E (S16A)
MMWYCAALSGLSRNIGEDDRRSVQQWKKSDQEGQNLRKMAKNLPQCHFVQHESYEFTKDSTWAPLQWEARVKPSEHLFTFIITVSNHEDDWQVVRNTFTCITTQIKLHCQISVAKCAKAYGLTILVTSKYWEKI